VKVILEQQPSVLQLLTKTSRRCWWDKYQDWQSDLHVEGWNDREKGI